MRVREFVTTDTELKPIAAPARIGSRRTPNATRTPAATGIKAVLYANAQNRFVLIFRTVFRLSWIEAKPKLLP